MKGVSILDMQDGVSVVSLGDLLDLLGDEAGQLQWRVSSDLECLGDGAGEFYRLADTRTLVDTAGLNALARSIHQIIDGAFTGYTEADTAPRIVIRAVDGSAFDLEARDERILDKVRQRYRDVIDIPQGEGNGTGIV